MNKPTLSESLSDLFSVLSIYSPLVYVTMVVSPDIVLDQQIVFTICILLSVNSLGNLLKR